MKVNQFNPMKCLMHESKIWDILSGGIPYPVTCNVDITNVCNQNCIWCYVSEVRKKNPCQMSVDRIKVLLDDLVHVGVKGLLLTGGGEPLVHQDIFKIFDLLRDSPINVGMSTNGVLLGDYADNIPYGRFKYIRVSFDAGCRETYNKLHRGTPTDFDSVLEGALKVRGKKGKCLLGMSFLATADNFLEIEDAVQIANDVGFDYIAVRPAIFGNLLTADQAEICIAACSALETKTQVYCNVSRFENFIMNSRYPCVATPLVGVVSADSRLNICCQYRGLAQFQWGDLDKDRFSVLWGSTEHKALLKKVRYMICPRCRMMPYNELIERAFVNDEMHGDFL